MCLSVRELHWKFPHRAPWGAYVLRLSATDVSGSCVGGRTGAGSFANRPLRCSSAALRSVFASERGVRRVVPKHVWIDAAAFNQPDTAGVKACDSQGESLR